MPYSDTGANRVYTRLRGPLLVGQKGGPGEADVNGTAALPLYGYFNAPDVGDLLANASSSTYEVRKSVGGTSICSWSSVGYSVGTTAFESTGGVARAIYISQATGALMTSSGGGVAPVASPYGLTATLVYDAGRKKLCVFSTVDNFWVATAVMTSS